MAVAQELDQLMLDGCRVFHDVPYRYGNIDHVVVSRSGVYTINTKMRGRPDALNNANVTVDYTAGVLRFPDADFPIPISGPKTEARWLSRELSEATGENIQVEPMLAFPGWYFKERIGRGSVFVFNPTRPKKFFLRDKVTISPQMIQRIAYQLERLVRLVPPMLKDESQKWLKHTMVFTRNRRCPHDALQLWLDVQDLIAMAENVVWKDTIGGAGNNVAAENDVCRKLLLHSAGASRSKAIKVSAERSCDWPTTRSLSARTRTGCASTGPADAAG